jgi:hypothetical protein
MMSHPRFSTLTMPAVFGLALIFSLVRVTETASHEYFVEKPHLVAASEAGLAAVSWLSPDSDANWLVRYRTPPSTQWQQVAANLVRRVPGDEMRTRRLYEAVLERVARGQSFEFEVLRNGSKAFETTTGTTSVAAQSAARANGL